MNSPAFACVSRPLNVMTRENMLVLLESSGKKLAECEGECEVDTGRRLGADLVITGEVLRFGSNYKLNLRLHETRDGQLLAGAQASGATTDELDRNTKQAVVELLAPLRKTARPATQYATAAAGATGCRIALPAEGCPKHSELKGTFDDAFQGSEKGQGPLPPSRGRVLQLLRQHADRDRDLLPGRRAGGLEGHAQTLRRHAPARRLPCAAALGKGRRHLRRLVGRRG
jgi:hypothetical protein